MLTHVSILTYIGPCQIPDTNLRSIIMPVTGPDFISLQARDLDASQAFYEQYLGLVRSPVGPPHAVVFETKPIAFALRDVIPGTDLASVAQPGVGAAIWLHATDIQAIHDALVADDHTIVSAPIDGPFGRTFTFADPDGYQITLHDGA
jgi:predicted enzyme related to lactoylglutathione lyase